MMNKQFSVRLKWCSGVVMSLKCKEAELQLQIVTVILTYRLVCAFC